MPRLLYLSLMRMPTEKAHGLQIMQNCEAFADAGYDVTLWAARRFNSPELKKVKDWHAFYGVEPVFNVKRMFIVDMMPLAGGKQGRERIAFYLQIITYIITMFLRLFFTRADVYYSRDEWLLYALSFFKPKSRLVYEAHLVSPNERGRKLQTKVVQRVGKIVAITEPLKAKLIELGNITPEKILVAHDGIRARRFQHNMSQSEARAKIGWSDDAFVVGWVGRLHLINQDKGVGLLVDAIAHVPNVSLAIVGGPDDMAEQLRQHWHAKGLPANRFLYVGQVPSTDVPRYLAACDICAMPHPATEQFANYTSPLKLFEYMASRRALLASDLPAWRDVLRHEESALLLPPDDVLAWAAAIWRIKDDPYLGRTLADYAYVRVMANYTWAQRAETIRAHIESATN
jgi:glycosyltransferase involved in cell wall biosynthesis